jgi:hypothetical protein
LQVLVKQFLKKAVNFNLLQEASDAFELIKILRTTGKIAIATLRKE